MTDQELFDKVAIHLLTQGQKAQDSFGQCFYRTPEGLKCAVGVCIDDEHYSPEFEGTSVGAETRNELALSKALIASGVRRDQFRLLQRLQVVHDACESPYWALQLADVAAEFGLTFKEAHHDE